MTAAEAGRPTILWSAEQCATHRGVSVNDWERQVFAGQEPLPVVNDGGVRLWDSRIVRTWRLHGELGEDEWFAQRCAAHHGITRAHWQQLVREGRAPAPKRRIGTHNVWDAREARAPLRRKPRRPPLPEPAAGEWTAATCATFLDMPEKRWNRAVAENRAPKPIRVDEGGRELWLANVVRTLKLPLGRRQGEWIAQEAAEHARLAPATWSAYVTAGTAPQPRRSVDGSRLWDADEVRAFADARAAKRVKTTPKRPDAWTAKECADHLGISPRAWRAAVRAGRAPQPSGYEGGRTRLWTPDEVRTFGEAS